MTEPMVSERPKRARPTKDAFRENYLLAEQRFRHEEGRAIGRLASRAQLFAFTLAVLFLGAGTGVVLLGHDVAGAAIAATSSVSLATAFLAGTASRKAATDVGARQLPTQATAADLGSDA